MSDAAEITLYRELLTEIKVRVRQAQHKAAISANEEMISMYWDIGCMIAARQKREGWGAGVIPRLAVDLKNDLPEEKGFSERNLKYMIRFAREYPSQPIVQRPVAQLQNPALEPTAIVPQAVAKLEPPALPPIMQRLVAQIPWGHNIVLFEKIKDLSTRLWYAQQVLEQGWSRDTLIVQIKSRAHERQGAAITNFAATLPAVHANLAQGLLKDPYLFDFFTLEEPFHERELETSLLAHLQKFLLELGRGFAFVGSQYRLEVSDGCNPILQ
ncbi:MAG: PDDEXK nuclease domain-containing protein [Planctomycetota bacterium]